MSEIRKLREMRQPLSRMARARLLMFLNELAGDGLAVEVDAGVTVNADDLFQDIFPDEYEEMGNGKSLYDVMFEVEAIDDGEVKA